MSAAFWEAALSRPSQSSGKTQSSSNSLARAEVAVRRIVAEQHDRPSLVSDIACAIGVEIVEGIRRPGEDLNSVELSRRYNTSRTPIREALMLLEKEGLVDIPPRRRPRVMIFDIGNIRDVYLARGSLLELVASGIAQRASLKDLARLECALGRMQDAQDDVHAYIWENVEFYDISTEIAGNRFVKRVIDSLLLRTLPLRRFSLSHPGRLQKSLDDHVRLVRAYIERDEHLAIALIRSNHRTALELLGQLIKS